jgi:hypothetical protein
MGDDGTMLARKVGTALGAAAGALLVRSPLESHRGRAAALVAVGSAALALDGLTREAAQAGAESPS